MDTRSDSELLLDVARRDGSAFAALFDRHHGPVFRFVYRYSGSTDVAEDLTQDVFVELLSKSSRFDVRRGELRTWLFSIARNLALKHFRREHPRMPLDDETEVAAGDSGPLDRILSAEIAVAVQEAIAALPPLQREVLILIEYEDLSLAEAASVVNADVAAVKSRLHRARERLKTMLGPLHERFSVGRSGANE